MSDEVNENQPENQGQQPDAELELDLGKLQEERDALFDRLARVTADFANSRRRLEEDQKQAIAFANGSLITALLPVIDNLERAMAVDQSKADVPTIIKGMELIHAQWIAVFKSQHVEQIAPQPGDKFDPRLHQAIMQQPTEEFKDAKEPVVVNLLQKGYAMRDRVLRPAQVSVNAIG